MSQLLENPSRKMSIKPNTTNSTAQIQNGAVATTTTTTTTTNALAEKTEQSEFFF